MWKKIAGLPITYDERTIYRVSPGKEGDLVVERWEQEDIWEEVTKDCYPTFHKSTTCEGYYIALIYHNDVVALIGGGKLKVTKGYRLERPKGAIYSFKVFRHQR